MLDSGHGRVARGSRLICVAVFVAAILWCATTFAKAVGSIAVWCANQAPPAAFSEAGAVLVDGGAARAEIVVATPHLEEATRSARELSHYLNRITGATIPIVREPSGAQTTIRVGLLKSVDDAPSLPRDLADNPEAFVIRVRRGRVDLLAATELGIPHVVYGLLDKIGCRWFFAGDAWEVLPSARYIAFSRGEMADGPDYGMRRIWYGYGMHEIYPLAKRGEKTRTQQDWEKWNRHNRMIGWLRGGIGHHYAKIANPRRHFDAHPEWFPLRDGARTPKGQICTSNFEVARRAVVEVEASVGTERPRTGIVLIPLGHPDKGRNHPCDLFIQSGRAGDHQARGVCRRLGNGRLSRQ